MLSEEMLKMQYLCFQNEEACPVKLCKFTSFQTGRKSLSFTTGWKWKLFSFHFTGEEWWQREQIAQDNFKI